MVDIVIFYIFNTLDVDEGWIKTEKVFVLTKSHIRIKPMAFRQIIIRF